MEEPEVPGPEEFDGTAGEGRAEEPLRFGWAVPIAPDDSIARHPDLADLAGRQRDAPVRIDDLDAKAGERAATARDRGGGR